ncbi:TPA: response regulator transcription factor [Streptococcus agalactiae]
MRVLIAEDEEQMSRVLSTAISHQGYVVDVAYDGQTAIDLANQNAYDVMVMDVMIMDVMMPVKTGVEAVKEIRQSGNKSHIIMLTAMAEIDDRVTGLDAGADDYLTKPFSLKELLARLRSMSRRLEDFTPNVLSLGRVTLSVGEQELQCENTIRLAGKEAKMLAFFMLNHDKELSTQQLFEHVWGADKDQEDVDEGYVFIYVSYLRQKLQAISANLEIIGQEGSSYKLSEINGG